MDIKIKQDGLWKTLLFNFLPLAGGVVSGDTNFANGLKKGGIDVATLSDIPQNTWRPIQDNLTSTSTVESLSANLGKELKTLVDSKAPINHASSATTYGVGTTSNYGHVKLVTGDLSGKTAANGIAAALNHTHGQYSLTTHSHTEFASSTHSHDNYLPLTGGTMVGTINAQAVLPKTTNAYDLGTTTNLWRRIYAGTLLVSNSSGNTVIAGTSMVHSTNWFSFVGLTKAGSDAIVAAGGTRKDPYSRIVLGQGYQSTDDRYSEGVIALMNGEHAHTIRGIYSDKSGNESIIRPGNSTHILPNLGGTSGYIVNTIGSSTVGNSSTPVFINEGIATTCSNVDAKTLEGKDLALTRFYYHVHSAFCNKYTPTYYTSTDGTAFTETTLNKELFAEKDHNKVAVLTDTIKACRWIFQANDIAYSNINRILIGYAYSSPNPLIDISFERSADGNTWNSLLEVSGETSNAKLVSYKLPNKEVGSDGNRYFRITIHKVDTSNTDTKYLASIRLLSYRPGDQGLGIEYEKPYKADGDKTIYPWNDNDQDLGKSNCKWKNIYATTFTGNLSGNATTAGSITNQGAAATKNLSYTSSGKNYAVVADSNNNLYVNVPWSDSGSAHGGYTATTAAAKKIGCDANGHVVIGSTLTASDVGAAASSHSHSELSTAGDNRNVATTPNDYSNKLIFLGLKAKATIGSPSTDTYSYVLGLRGWSDNSGGYAWEMAFNNSGIFVRKGATTTWDSWSKLSNDPLKFTTSAHTLVPLGINAMWGGGGDGTWTQTVDANTPEYNMKYGVGIAVKSSSTRFMEIWCNAAKNTTTSDPAGLYYRVANVATNDVPAWSNSVRILDNSNISSTTNTATVASLGSTASKSYQVQMHSNGKLVVNVPWTDTNTKVTQSAATNSDVWRKVLLSSNTTSSKAGSITSGTSATVLYDNDLAYNPSTNTLAATNFEGNWNGYNFSFVSSLPSSPDANTIYFIYE